MFFSRVSFNLFFRFAQKLVTIKIDFVVAKIYCVCASLSFLSLAVLHTQKKCITLFFLDFCSFRLLVCRDFVEAYYAMAHIN